MTTNKSTKPGRTYEEIAEIMSERNYLCETLLNFNEADRRERIQEIAKLNAIIGEFYGKN